MLRASRHNRRVLARGRLEGAGRRGTQWPPGGAQRQEGISLQKLREVGKQI